MRRRRRRRPAHLARQASLGLQQVVEALRARADAPAQAAGWWLRVLLAREGAADAPAAPQPCPRAATARGAVPATTPLPAWRRRRCAGAVGAGQQRCLGAADRAARLRRCDAGLGRVHIARHAALEPQEPDNAAAWLELAARDPQAVDEALFRAAKASRFDGHRGRLAAWVLQATPEQLPAMQRYAAWQRSDELERAADARALAAAARACSDAARRDANRDQLCDGVARWLTQNLRAPPAAETTRCRGGPRARLRHHRAPMARGTRQRATRRIASRPRARRRQAAAAGPRRIIARMPEQPVIATRESRLALWQAEHVRALLRERCGARRDAARHDHARRPDPRSHAVQGRRQGPVRQGARGRARRRPRRPRGALAEGRADGPARRLRARPRCSSAKIRAMPSCRRATRRCDALPPGACVGTSSLRRVVQLLALRPDLRIEPLRGNLDTRLRKLDEGALRRHRAGRRRADAAGAGRAHRALLRLRADAAGGRPGRAGHRSARADARAVRARWPRSTTRRPGWPRMPNVPSRARWAAAAACRWPRLRELAGRHAAAARRARPCRCADAAAAARAGAGASRAMPRPPARSASRPRRACASRAPTPTSREPPSRPGRIPSEARCRACIVTRPQPQADEWVARAACARRRCAWRCRCCRSCRGRPRGCGGVGRAGRARPGGVREPGLRRELLRAAAARRAWPAGTRAAATGPGTVAGAARSRCAGGGDHRAAADAEQFDSEALWRRLAARDVAGPARAGRARRRRPRLAGRSFARARRRGRRSCRPIGARCRSWSAAQRACWPPRWPRRRATAGCSPARRRWNTCASWRRCPIGRRVVRWPPIRASRRRCARRASARCGSVRPTLDAVASMRGGARYNRCPHPTSDRDRCTVNQPAVEPSPPRAAIDPMPPAVAAARGAGGAPWWLLLAALVLGAAALWLAWQTSQRVQSLEQELVRRQQDSTTLATEARVLARQAQDASRDAVAKVALLESRVAENTLQRTQLEDLLQSMTRSRDENMLSDIEAALRVAVQQSRDHRQHRAAAGHAQAGRRAPGAQRAAAPGACAPRRGARPRPRALGGGERHLHAGDQGRRRGAHGRRPAAAGAARAPRRRTRRRQGRAPPAVPAAASAPAAAAADGLARRTRGALGSAWCSGCSMRRGRWCA